MLSVIATKIPTQTPNVLAPRKEELNYDWLKNADSPAQGNGFPGRVQTLFSRRVKQEPKKLSGHSLGRLGRHVWKRL